MMSVTDTDHGLSTPAWEQIRLRAQWLRTLPDEVRDGLDAVPLRQVDALFDAWLDARRPVGDHGGG